MDRIVELEAVLKQEMKDYAGPAYKASTHFVEDAKQRIYTVVVIPDHDYPTNAAAGVVVMARIIANKVVIDEDITDRPLVDELVRAGIPREQIILAYAGESPPAEPASE